MTTAKRAEFIALMAMLMATIALSIDAILPAMSEIGAALTPDAPNRAQLLVGSFFLGLGVGTLFMGSLSDAFGRRPIVLWGMAAYVVAALACWLAPSLEMMLVARFMSGAAAAAARVTSTAMVRDRFVGREMARTLSLVMSIFTVVPAFAPMVGALVMSVAGWRTIYLVFVAFGFVSLLWFGLRQPETLRPENRLPLHLKSLLSAAREVLTHPVSRRAIVTQTFNYAAFFSLLSSSQMIFSQSFGAGDTFAQWMLLVAGFSAFASVLNARLVMRLGALRVTRQVIRIQIAVAIIALALFVAPLPKTVHFVLWILWMVGMYFQSGLTIGNLNAVAMAPMGHIAGTASSISSATATVVSVAIAAPVGLAFDGTPIPLLIGVAGFAVLSYFSMPRGED